MPEMAVLKHKLGFVTKEHSINKVLYSCAVFGGEELGALYQLWRQAADKEQSDCHFAFPIL